MGFGQGLDVIVLQTKLIQNRYNPHGGERVIVSHGKGLLTLGYSNPLTTKTQVVKVCSLATAKVSLDGTKFDAHKISAVDLRDLLPP